jgi:hypothetical protein
MFVDPELSPVLIEDGEGAALRPKYHITAQEGWMNDPVGMFEYMNNTHVLFQVLSTVINNTLRIPERPPSLVLYRKAARPLPQNPVNMKACSIEETCFEDCRQYQ